MSKFGKTYEAGNRLIDALPADERADVVPALELIKLEAAVVTHAPNAAYDWVLFPFDAVLSVVATLADGDTAEVGTVGNEHSTSLAAAVRAMAALSGRPRSTRGIPTHARLSLGYAWCAPCHR